MTMRRKFQVACVAAALAFSTLAHADDVAIAEAQTRFNEGLELADDGKYEEARLKYLQAAAVLNKVPAVLFNLATMEMRTGHEMEAIEHFRAFLRVENSDTRITDSMREKAKRYSAELLKKVGQINVIAPTGTQLSVNGKRLDEFPKDSIVVTAGRHTLEGAFQGKIKSVTVHVNQGEIATAKLDFDDGGTTYASPEGSEARRTAAGFAVPIALGVLGIGGVVMGGIFGAASQSSKDEAESLRRASPGLCAQPASAACNQYDDKRSSAESQATLAWVGYVSGGVLLAASVATFVFWPRSEKSSTSAQGMRLTPLVGPRVGGASFQLSF